MRRKSRQIGLMIGVMMMTAMTGTGTVFAAAGPANTGTEVAAPKSNTGFCGRVKKVEKDKIILEEAELIVKESGNESKEEPAADFEKGTEKWKLNGRKIEIKLDDETKFYKEMIVPKFEKESQDKTQDSSDNNNTKSKGIPLKKIREGILARAVLRDDGSGIASEIMMLSGVKEVKSASQEV